jgi:hypothetical protein
MNSVRQLVKRRYLGAAVALILVAVFISTPVFAFSMNINDFVWDQVYDETYTLPESYYDGGGQREITFEGVANAPSLGRFTVTLEKKGLFGIWSKVGNSYEVQQHNNPTLNVPRGYYVMGQWFKVNWGNRDKGTYRIVLKDASNHQQTSFRYVRFASN